MQHSFKTVFSSLALAKLAQLKAALCELGQEVNGFLFSGLNVYIYTEMNVAYVIVYPLYYIIHQFSNAHAVMTKTESTFLEIALF